MEDCIFCKIIKGEIPSNKVFENEYVYAFRDIAPCAPVHVLVVPKKHISSAMQLTQEDDALLGKIFEAVNEVARICGVDKSGYRVVTPVHERYEHPQCRLRGALKSLSGCAAKYGVAKGIPKTRTLKNMRKKYVQPC